MATKKTDDLTITVKDGATLIKELITAINDNTKAVIDAGNLKKVAENATHGEAKEEQPKAEPVAASPVPQGQLPTAPTPNYPQQPIAQYQVPVAPNSPTVPTQPMPQYPQQQVQQPNQVQGTPLPPTPVAAPPTANVPSTTTPQATPSYPVNEVGPAQVTPTTSTVPPTVTGPTASAGLPQNAQSGLTLEMISNAGAQLCDMGKMGQCLDILHSHGVDSLTTLAPQYYAEVAEQFRALGANI